MSTEETSLVVTGAGLFVSIAAVIATLITPTHKYRRAYVTLCVVFVAAGVISAAVSFYIYSNPPRSELAIISPPNGFQFADNFAVEVAGSTSVSNAIWVVAKDSDEVWYPLTEALKNSEDTWAASVRAVQIVSPVSLCAVVVDKDGASVFYEFVTSANVSTGLPRLPASAEIPSCIVVQPQAG